MYFKGHILNPNTLKLFGLVFRILKLLFMIFVYTITNWLGGKCMEDFIGLIAVVMVFSIPLTAIWTTHLRKSQKVKLIIVKDEIELEKLKYNNFLLETEKMRMDLQQKQANLLESSDPLVLDLQKSAQKEAKMISS